MRARESACNSPREDGRFTSDEWLCKAWKAWQQDLPAQAVEYFRRGFVPPSTNGALWTGYGMMLRELGRYEEAEETFRHGIRLTQPTKRSICFVELAELFDLQGKVKLAERWYRKAVAAAPKNNGSRLIILGDFLRRCGRLDEAEKCFRTATRKIDVDVDEALLNLGLVLRACGRYVEARNCFRKALAMDPKYKLAKVALRDVLPLVGANIGD